MIDEAAVREEMCRWGRSLFERGLTPGSSGNLGARLEDGFLVTPTNASLGSLDPDRLSKLDGEGVLVSGDAPTKEVPLHLGLLRARPQAGGVVHLHSTYATALSCLEDTDPEDTIPAITPYTVMRVGRVPLLPYMPPGSADMGPAVLRRTPDHAAVLLANHGPVVSARTLRDAVFAAEELEEAAHLALITRSLPVRRLSADQIHELQERFPLR